MEDVGKSDWKTNVIVGGLLFSLAILPPALAYTLDDSGWLFGWAIIFILGLTG